MSADIRPFPRPSKRPFVWFIEEHHFSDMPVPMRAITELYRRDGTPAQVGDSVLVGRENPAKGMIVGLGAVLDGKRTYGVMCHDGVNRMAYADRLQVLE